MSFHLSMKRASVCVHGGHDHMSKDVASLLSSIARKKRNPYAQSQKVQQGPGRFKKGRYRCVRMLREVQSQEGSRRFKKGSLRKVQEVSS